MEFGKRIQTPVAGPQAQEERENQSLKQGFRQTSDLLYGKSYAVGIIIILRH